MRDVKTAANSRRAESTDHAAERDLGGLIVR